MRFVRYGRQRVRPLLNYSPIVAEIISLPVPLD